MADKPKPKLRYYKSEARIKPQKPLVKYPIMEAAKPNLASAKSMQFKEQSSFLRFKKSQIEEVIDKDTEKIY